MRAIASWPPLNSALARMNSRFDYVFMRTYGALLLDELEDYQEIISALSQRIEADGSGIAFHNRALAYWEIGESDKALSDFTKAEKALPKDYLPAQIKGMLLQKLGRLPEAIQSLNRAIEVSPNAQTARMCRGYMLVESRQFADAIVDFEHALASDPSSKAARHARANALDKLKELKRDASPRKWWQVWRS